MKKKIMIFCLIGIFLISIFIGCISNENQQNQEQDIPELTESEESYKASCNELNLGSLDSEPETYKGTRVKCKGVIIEVIDGKQNTMYRISDWELGIDDCGTIYVTSDQETNFIENDVVQIWGEVLGEYTHYLGGGFFRTQTHVWAFFIEEYEEEPKHWDERVVISYGPWWDGVDDIKECTEPYYINTELGRINWSMYGGSNCNFQLKVWKIGEVSSSNSTDTIHAEEASGTLLIDDGAGYYYFEMSFENLYYYQLRISEYK